MQAIKEGESCKECGQRSPRYNGWRNYETWAVKLWLDNEEPSYRYWSEQARFLLSEEGQGAHRGRWMGLWDDEPDKLALSALAEQLKEAHEERADELGLYNGESMGVFADLYRAAESEIDWHEIAGSMLEHAKESA